MTHLLLDIWDLTIMTPTDRQTDRQTDSAPCHMSMQMYISLRSSYNMVNFSQVMLQLIQIIHWLLSFRIFTKNYNI